MEVDEIDSAVVKEKKGATIKFHQHNKGGQKKETDGNGFFIIEVVCLFVYKQSNDLSSETVIA